MALDPTHPLLDGRTGASALIEAYRGGRPAVTPVWFMRQAGRSLPEYRARRAGTRMMDACLDPQMVADITIQPVERHGVDAAILFSDIVIPLHLAGVDVDIAAGVGPVFGSPVRTLQDVEALPDLGAAGDGGPYDRALDVMREAVAITVGSLGSTPLIGFAGAPFTLAAYMVEGRPSRDHLAARTLMHADPAAWGALMEWAADAAGLFLRAQALAGASALQLFDSWVGSLSRADYAAHCAPASARAFSHVADLPQPRVHFGVHTAHLLEDMKGVGADVMGVDYTMPLDEANRILGGATPLQGNIDPALLAAPEAVLHAHVRDVCERGRAAPGHVVNLGHGVPPDTDPAVLTRVVEWVHEFP